MFKLFQVGTDQEIELGGQGYACLLNCAVNLYYLCTLRHPVQLSCQHIFCYECLALTRNSTYDEFSCPHCRRKIRKNIWDLKRPRFTMKVMETCSKGIINLKKEEIEKITKKAEDVSADSIDSIDWSLYLPRVTFTG